MNKREELAKLRRALRIDPVNPAPLILPDCGNKAVVCMRYKGAELSFVLSPEHVGHDESLSRLILKTRDTLKELAELSSASEAEPDVLGECG